MGELRWRLADDEATGQTSLFGMDDLVGPERGTGKMSGLEFLHVAAKRILNPVPPASRMPFRWTINVYRGCSHACVYCLAGDTSILMADGSSQPLRAVRRGDQVMGVRRENGQLKRIATDVLAHWRTTKPAYEVVLRNGTTLIASGDHRFLTARGWKHVTAEGRRRHLSPADDLCGPDADDPTGLAPQPGLRVVSIEPLGIELPMYDITTGTGTFLADGVVSHNCFARPTHEYLGLNFGDDFDRKIVVKINAVEKLRAELADPSWTGAPVAMGTNTDPYQRCEGKYKLTRGVLAALAERGNPFSILTKSPLVLRDLDLLTAAARHTDVSVNFSIATLDEAVWRATEPGTPHPARRIAAMRTLREHGIRSGALIAPVLPELSDRPEQLQQVARAIRSAGGEILGVLPLHLRPGTREHFLTWLENYDPRLHQRYLNRYAGTAYAPKRYGEHLRAIIAAATVHPS